MVHSSVRAESSGSGHDRVRLGKLVDGIATNVGLSGLIRIDLDGSLAVQRVYGLAHRGLGVPTTVDTQNRGQIEQERSRSPAARRVSPRWR